MGSLGWTPIRVLQAKQEFGCETLRIDKALMEAMTVPSLDQYKSDTEAEDQPMDEEDLLAAQGLQMAVYREQEPGQEGHDSDLDSLARSLWGASWTKGFRSISRASAGFREHGRGLLRSLRLHRGEC